MENVINKADKKLFIFVITFAAVFSSWVFSADSANAGNCGDQLRGNCSSICLSTEDEISTSGDLSCGSDMHCCAPKLVAPTCKKTAEECTKDSDCCSGLTCETMGETLTCRTAPTAKKKEGETCTGVPGECEDGLECLQKSGEMTFKCAKKSGCIGPSCPPPPPPTDPDCPPGSGICIPKNTGLASASVKDILGNLLTWMLEIVGIIALIGFVISGIQYITAAGSEDQMDTAKRNMKYSIIGIVVVLASFVIIQAIEYALNASPFI